MPASRSLIFGGSITGGVGLHNEMVIPGRSVVAGSPDDWPEELCPGSLNVLIEEYPDSFSPPSGRRRGAYQLDDGNFRPEFVIEGNQITENKLLRDGKPASAQVWRALLHVANRSEPISCWVLRRFGSNVGKGMGGNVLEVVAQDHLRSAFDLEDGQRVKLELIEGRSKSL